MMNVNSHKDRLGGMFNFERRKVALFWAMFVEKIYIFMPLASS